MMVATAIPMLVVVRILDRYSTSRGFFEIVLPSVGSAVGIGLGALSAVWLNKTRRLRHRAFVSFSYADRPFVEDLVARLRERRVKLVMPTEEIAVGDSISARLRELIASCSHVVVIVSPTYKKSEWPELELAMAGRRTKIIPVLHKTDELLSELRGVLHARLDTPTDPGFEDLVRALPNRPLSNSNCVGESGCSGLLRAALVSWGRA